MNYGPEGEILDSAPKVITLGGVKILSSSAINPTTRQRFVGIDYGMDA
jgi:hypothetical protein